MVKRFFSTTQWSGVPSQVFGVPEPLNLLMPTSEDELATIALRRNRQTWLLTRWLMPSRCSNDCGA